MKVKNAFNYQIPVINYLAQYVHRGATWFTFCKNLIIRNKSKFQFISNSVMGPEPEHVHY
jgi:hypothetical protein